LCGVVGVRVKNAAKTFSDFFKNTSAFDPVFLLLVRGHHEQKGGHRPCKKIQHAPPNPGNQDTLDRGTQGEHRPYGFRLLQARHYRKWGIRGQAMNWKRYGCLPGNIFANFRCEKWIMTV
jgi:hypothetical protein